MRLAAGPERQRRRRLHELRAHEAGIGAGQGFDQLGVTGPEPGKQLGIRGAASQDFRLGRPAEHSFRALGDVPRCPPVDVTRVPQEVFDLPPRAGRDGRIEPGSFCRLGEQPPLVPQYRQMLSDLHAVIVPACVPSSLPGRSAAGSF